MSEVERVLVGGDDGITPKAIADRLSHLLSVSFNLVGTDFEAVLPQGAWLNLDTERWAPFDDSPESGAGFLWEIAVNGGAGDSVALARRVFDELAASTDWKVGLYLASELVDRRPHLRVA